MLQNSQKKEFQNHGTTSLAHLSKTEKAIKTFSNFPNILNHNGGIMVSMLASCAVDHGFEPRSDQTKDYKIGICCFSAKHAGLRRKTKDWLAWNQDNVSV